MMSLSPPTRFPCRLRLALPLWGLVWLLLSLFLAGCATTGPGGERSVIIISTAQEVQIGAAVDQNIRQEYQVLNDPQLATYVTGVGQRVAAHSERQDVTYSFILLLSDEVNAFAAPGGYIYVTTGLLEAAGDEAELAGVLGHEIGHVVGRHSVRRLQTAYGAALAADLVLGDRGTLQAIAAVATQVVLMKNSRENELESDHFGIKYSYAAGYDPRAILGFFGTLLELQGGPSPGGVAPWFSTHPATEERIGKGQEILLKYDLSRPLDRGEDRYRKALARYR